MRQACSILKQDGMQWRLSRALSSLAGAWRCLTDSFFLYTARTALRVHTGTHSQVTRLLVNRIQDQTKPRVPLRRYICIPSVLALNCTALQSLIHFWAFPPLDHHHSIFTSCEDEAATRVTHRLPNRQARNMGSCFPIHTLTDDNVFLSFSEAVQPSRLRHNKPTKKHQT